MDQIYIEKAIEAEQSRKTRNRFDDSDYERIYKAMFRIFKEANMVSDRLIESGKTKDDCESAEEKRRLNGYILHPDLLDKVNDIMRERLNRGNISATLQYARRQLDNKRIRLDQVIMASPEGLFLPKGIDDPRIFAYAVSNLKELNSRAKTQNPIFAECMKTNPEAMREAILAANADWEIPKNEGVATMEPWAVFSKVMDADILRYNEIEENYYDDDWWEEQ